MNILIIGNGGREHAFAWKINQSKECKKLFVAPGNAGTSLVATNVAIAVDDFEKLGAFCLEQKINLILVGPEVPLVKGIRDYFSAHEKLKTVLMIGPGKEGAQLEGSKDFSKQFMLKHGIPTAGAKTFLTSQTKDAEKYLESLQ